MLYINKLYEIKKTKSFTNAEIAKLSNIPLATITRIFNGSTPNPTFETIAQIAIAMGVSLDELTGFASEVSSDVNFSVGSTLNTYADLLAEKDERIKEKDKVIEILTDMNKQSRTQLKRVLWFTVMFALLIAVILFVDITNGHFGYFRY